MTKQTNISIYFNFRISDRGDLTIKKVQAQMEGAYECRASNGEGNDSVAANLKVVRETTIIEGKYILINPHWQENCSALATARFFL